MGLRTNPSDDAGINAIIRKSADGKTEVSTVIEPDPENTQPNNVTKKKTVNKNKRQGNKQSE